jgi:hypothetical protein
LAARVETEYRSIARSIFEWVPRGESYALITSCSDVVDFLKSSETGLAIGLVLDSYWVEPEYRFVVRLFLDGIVKESPIPRLPLRAKL